MATKTLPVAFFDVCSRERFGAPGGAVYRNTAQLVAAELDRLLSFAESHGVTVCATSCQNPACVPVVGPIPASVTFMPCASTSPDLEGRLRAIPADEWVVFGRSAAICLTHVAELLASMGRRVTVVRDAVVDNKTKSREGAAPYLDALAAKGIALATVDETIDRLTKLLS